MALATRFVLPHPQLTGKELERLVGHWAHVLLVRRDMLSVCESVYGAIPKSYLRRQCLWPSARRKPARALDLLPLAWGGYQSPLEPPHLGLRCLPFGFGVAERDARMRAALIDGAAGALDDAHARGGSGHDHRRVEEPRRVPHRKRHARCGRRVGRDAVPQP